MTKMSDDEARAALGKIKPLDPMIAGALTRLQEIGPKWTDDQRLRWSELFVSMVAMLYPPRPPRKSRAKGKQEPTL